MEERFPEGVFGSDFCDIHDGTVNAADLGQASAAHSAAESDVIHEFLSMCLRQFSDYKVRTRGAADGTERDSKVRVGA